MGYELPRVTGFCFCFSLRTGTLIIGYFSMLSAILAISSTATFICLVSAYVAENQNNPPQGHTADDIKSNAVRLYIVHGLQIIVFVFYFIISLFLVIGAHKDIPRYMRHYFLAGMVNLVFSLVVAIVSFVFTGFVATVSQLTICAIMFYFLLVIRSSYLDLEERAKPPAYQMDIYYPTTQSPLFT